MSSLTEVSEVLDGRLFVTSAFVVYDMDESEAGQYDEIVTVNWAEDDSSVPDISTTGCQFCLRDHGKHDHKRFEDGVEYVVDALERGDSVLVHCSMGVNRSVAIVSAALGIVEGVSAGVAIERVRERHDGVSFGGMHPDSITSVERVVDG